MRVIIVGNNVAGITTAKEMRALSPEAEITIFSDEPYHYYPRPMLIDFIAGKVPEEKLFMNKPEWYAQNRFDVRLSTKVERIDPAKSAVHAAGQWHPYDSLVLATGASAYVPPTTGLPKKWAMTLRTLDDAKLIRARLPYVRVAVIVGGGLLGLETANALHQAKPGLPVHVLERGDYPLQRQLDAEGGAMLGKMISDLGIDLHLNSELASVEGTDEEMVVKLKSGEAITTQLLIISAGVRPNTGLAKYAGLAVGKGLQVNARMCCGPEGRIYAVGDVAEHEGKTYGIIPAALEQAKVVARKALGLETPEYTGTMPSNTLKVMGIDLTSAGIVVPPMPGYEEIRAASPDGKVYKKYIIKDGKLAGAILLGTKKGAQALQRKVKEGADVTANRTKLSDVNFDLM